jgi:hypothetical protein
MRRFVLLAALALACAPFAPAHSATGGCTVAGTGSEYVQWWCTYTANGPSTYTVASTSGWEIRRWGDGDWETLAADRTGSTGATGVARGEVPTVAGDYVQLIVWRIFTPVYNPATHGYLVYQDGVMTASS